MGRVKLVLVLDFEFEVWKSALFCFVFSSEKLRTKLTKDEGREYRKRMENRETERGKKDEKNKKKN